MRTPALLLSASILASTVVAAAQAQTADDLRRIWNDPSAIDRSKEQDERARTPAQQQAAQQRAALEAAQRAVAGLPEEERRRIQGSLATLGLYQGARDGNLASPETATAIGEWQKARQRPQTGKLTPPEAKALNDEAAAKSIKERLDSDTGIAARRAEAAKVVPPEILARLFDGAREDVIVLSNETPAAPNIVRTPGAAPSFRQRRAEICAQYGWQTGGDLAAFLASELAQAGAEKLTPDLARVCAEPRPPVDLVLLERRHLFEQAPDKVQLLLAELRDRKLAVLRIAAQSDAAGFRARQAEAARRAEEEKQRQEAARKAEEERRKQEAARIAADDPVKRRKASEPRARILTDALLDRLRAELAGSGAAGQGGEEFRRWLERRKNEGRAVADLRASVDDYGEGRRQGRAMEAIAVEVHLDLKSGETTETDCLVFAWLEETASRQPAVFACDRIAALEQWKADNGFKSKWR